MREEGPYGKMLPGAVRCDISEEYLGHDPKEWASDTWRQWEFSRLLRVSTATSLSPWRNSWSKTPKMLEKTPEMPAVRTHIASAKAMAL
jgi:hypothetical protein